MKVIVCGSRHSTDKGFVFAKLDEIHAAAPITRVIEGGQRRMDKGQIIGGVDYWANRWSAMRGIPCDTVKADWDDIHHPGAIVRRANNGRRYDAGAGPRRNGMMLERKPDAVVAFPGGTGTADMMRQAGDAGVPIIRINERTRSR